MKHRWIAALLALGLLLPGAAWAQYYEQMPLLLSFTQETNTQTVAENVFFRKTYPDTACDAIDEEMRLLIDRMAQENLQLLPLSPADTQSYLDVGAVISRSGESMLSFLTLAEVSRDKRMLHVDFEACVYDAQTGLRVSLTDIFPAQGDVWALLGEEIRRTFESAFPAREPDSAALDALCSPQAIKGAAFTLGAARLSLIYRADAVYPGAAGLLHVNIGYSGIRDRMTDYGKRQTDNSRFRMLALTFDDGPVRGATRGVLDALRSHGAQATFFVVGDRFANAHDMLLREQNANHSIQSHTYTHRYPEQLGKNDTFDERKRMEDELGEVIGVLPAMMRAPGGHAAYYAQRGIGYPMIQWSFAGGDSGNPHIDQIADKVIVSADDGEIALLHDLNGGSPKYTGTILDVLTKKGFLFVTVEELFEDAGIAMQENVIYYSPTDIRDK